MDKIWIPRPKYLRDPAAYPTEIPLIRAGFVYDQAGISYRSPNNWNLKDPMMGHLRELDK